MPRPKKERLKKRSDGRYRCKYKNMYFYGSTSDEALALRDAYKRLESRNELDRPACPTVESYAATWIKRAKAGVRKQTARETSILLDKLISRYGYLILSDIKPSDIKELYSLEFDGLSNSYIQSAAQTYKAFFDSAVDDGYCKINPARMKSARPHKGSTGSHRAITLQERNWILNLCTDHRAHPAVMAMLYAGIRPQEAKALDLDASFDRVNKTLLIQDFVHLSDYNHYEIDSTGKSDNAVRTVPVFPPLYNVIKDKHGYLVTSADNKPVTVQAWRSVWESYVSKMEEAINGCPKRWYGRTKEHKRLIATGQALPEWKKFTVLPYDLRHSFCTMCRDASPPIEINTVIHWMGHSDASMILKIYDEFSYERGILEARRLETSLFEGQNGGQNNKP